MKRNRIIYLILLIATMVLCYYYKSPISSMFYYGVLFLPIASLIYALIIYLGFKYTQDLDKKFVTKGDKVNFKLSIYNENIFLYPFIKVTFYNINSLYQEIFEDRNIMVKPFNKKDYEFSLDCKYRGYYEFGIKNIIIGDFLGIINIKHSVLSPKCVTVYPRIIPLTKFCIKSNFEGDSERSIQSLYEDTTMLSDIRKYAWGDSIRKVHWKLTAKKQELMVKNYESTAGTIAYVILDSSINYFGKEENAILEDIMVESAIACINYCLNNFITTHLIYYNNGTVVEQAKELSDFDALYQLLFQMKFDQKIAFDEFISLNQAMLIPKTDRVIITTQLSRRLYTQIYDQAVTGNHMILIYVYSKELMSSSEQWDEIDNILRSLEEQNVTCYKIEKNDDIKMILEK